MRDRTWAEDARVAALRRFAILDTPPEAEFDDAVALVKTICRVPIALVSLVDDCRQWFKAKIGVDAEQTALDTSVCALAIEQEDVFVIEDLSADARTAGMSLVVNEPAIRFYAGVPLVTSQGFALGSLCAIDTVARPGGLDQEQIVALHALGRQVVAHIELRTAIDTRDKTIADQLRRQRYAARDSATLRTMLSAQHTAIASGGDVSTVLQSLIDAALEAVDPADGVVVATRDGGDLVYRATNGTADAVGYRLAIATSFGGQSLREQATLITADAAADERVDSSLASTQNIGSMIAVPLTRQGRAFGVLKLLAAARDAFRSRDILIAQLLAGLIAASFTESAEAQALREVEESSASYRHIVDSAIDSAIISTDEAGIISSWSKGAETIMGWTEAETRGRHIGLIFTPEDNANDRPRIELARAEAEGRSPDRRWHIRKDGSRFFAEGAVTPLIGATKGFVKSLRDMTEEHATELELETSRLQLDTALETGLIGFFQWDVPTRTLTGDPRFAEFYGLPPQAASQGLPIGDVFRQVFASDQASLEAHVQEIEHRCADYEHSYRVHRLDGGTRWMLVRGRCIESDDGLPLTYVGTAVDVTQQRLAEERLSLSRERLELATRAAQLGGFDYKPQTGELEWDDRCRALFGLSPGVPVTYEGSFLGGLHPDDRDYADATVRAALDPAGDGTFDLEYRTIGHEDGVLRSILAKGMAMFVNGAPARLIGTVQDVTADRMARTRLAEAEERFRLAIKATNDAIWDWDLKSDHVLWNEALQTAFGHAEQDVEPTGGWWIAQIHPEDRVRVDHSIHALIEGTGTDWTDEYRFRRGDGSYADVRDRGYIIRDDAGRAVRMLGALLDQTDRKTIERNLQELNETLETSVLERTRELDRLWETSPDLLVVVDFTGIIQRVNPAWSLILGYRREELLGQPITAYVFAEDIALTEQALVTATAGPLPTVENRYVHKDGSVRWFSWVAAPTESEIYATGRHITADKDAQAALRVAEDQLRQSQKVEAIGQLTGGVAHDFNNLLTVIRGSTDLLRKPGLTEERRKRYIDAIAETADRAAKLTAQLLAFARRSSLKPEIFDVSAAIRSLQQMMGTLTGSMIEVDIRLPEEPCHVHADVSQFDTAIINMAVNARDAMDRRGKLTIAVSPADMIPASRSHGGLAGKYIAVSITDDGSGIPIEVLDQIFEPFYTSKAVGEGTGLGLSQVFGFAKQSGGEILVDSEPGHGSTFTLYLPRTKGDDVAERPAALAESDHRPGARVLVVEDNTEVNEFATLALGEMGHSTVRARSAEEALAKLVTETERFDLVFTDVVMPGMSGIELGKEIARLYPRLPVLLASGYSSVIVAEGSHGFPLLQKPYSIAELARAIEAVRGNSA
jgi:PAS domain S-box-containing protein